MATDPASASVRPDKPIFDFVLAAVLQHVLHSLLDAFAIVGVHDPEEPVERYWVGIREAEQLPPFLGYPTFVTIRDVPNPQTKVCCIDRELDARLAFPQ